MFHEQHNMNSSTPYDIKVILYLQGYRFQDSHKQEVNNSSTQPVITINYM